MTKVLITGGTGFIGSHLVARCVQAGHDVRVLARPENPIAKEYEKQGIEVVYSDIRDPQGVEQAVRGVKIVYHLAALVTDWAPKPLFREMNIESMRHICQASLKHGVEAFVNMSTCDVFGCRIDADVDEDTKYQYWGEPYPDTKIDAANLAWDFYGQGLPVTAVYPCWVYGPGDRTLVPLPADAIRKREFIFWSKQALMYPTYVDNLVDLAMLTASNPKAIGEGFLVHDGEGESIRNFTAQIAAAIGAPKPDIHIPYELAYSLAWMAQTTGKIAGRKFRPFLTTYLVKNFALRTRYSIDKAQRLLGWTPRIRYAEGFQRTMEWLKSSNPELWKMK